MKSYINGYTLANDVRMRRALFGGVFLFVEGLSDDRLYGMFVDASECQIIIAHTRDYVIEACRILENHAFAGVIGIIDADFDNVEGRPPVPQGVFRTELHDAECLMLCSGAFQKLLFQFASRPKLEKWTKEHRADVREHLLHQAALIGCLVWHSNREQLKLCFEKTDVSEYVSRPNLDVDLELFVTHVKNKSVRPDLQNESLIAGIRERLALAGDLWQVTRGHDFIDILGLALRKALGNRSALEVTRERLELDLRLAYSDKEFSQSQLFSEIRAWEGSHKDFRVMR